MKKKFNSMGRVAIALVLALSLSLVMTVPLAAAGLTNITATPDDNVAGATGVIYTIAFTTVTPLAVVAVADQIIITFPAGFDATGAAVDAATVTQSTTDPTLAPATATVVTLDVAADEPAGIQSIVLSGIINTDVAGDYAVTVETNDAEGTPATIDGPNDSPTFAIVADVLDAYLVEPEAGPYTAGTAFNVVVTAVDQFDNPLGADYSTDEPYTWTSTASDAPDLTAPEIGTLAAADFTDGVATKSVTLYAAEPSVTFTVLDNSAVTDTSAAITVDPDAIVAYTVEPAALIQDAGTPFNVVITAYDQHENLGDPTGLTYTWESTASVAPDGTEPDIKAPLLDTDFVTGIATKAVTLYCVESGVTFTVTDNNEITATSTAVFVEGIQLGATYYKTDDVVTVTVADDSANIFDVVRETVLVIADSDPTGHEVTLGLLETDVDTGIFTTTFTLVGTTPGYGELLVSHEDTIEVTFTGFTSDTAEVDNAAPTIDTLTPDDEGVVSDDPLVISANIADLNCGLTAGSLVMTVNGLEVVAVWADPTLSYTYEVGAAVEGVYEVTVDAEDNVGNAADTETWSFTYDVTSPVVSNQTPEPDTFISTRTPTVSFDVTDPNGIDRSSISLDIEYIDPVTPAITPTLSVATAYHVEYQVSTSEGADFVDGQAITVTVAATDLAGNDIAVDDQTWEFTYDATAPDLDAAVTGWTWDVVGEAPEDTDSRTTIMATFSEDLDEATVEASDFLVADLVTPSAIEVQDNLVFLTITEMATDATPSVDLVGEVSDLAGNAQTVGEIEEAVDNIDPILTVAVDPELGMDETDITITVSSSEALDALPSVEVMEADNDVVPVTMAATDTTAWEGTYTLDEANLDGVYAVTAGGTDMAANDALGVTAITEEDIGADGTETVFTLVNAPIDDTSGNGSVGSEDVTPTSGTISAVDWHLGVITFSVAPDALATVDYSYFAGAVASFEGDFTAPTVIITPTGDVPTTSPWIIFEFDEAVEVIAASLDGADVLLELYAVGEATYMLATTDLALGDHTISVLAADLAGNEMVAPETATLTVVVAPPATIDLFPGWNLISLPLIPDDPSIEAVLGEVTVDCVWGYDPINSPDDTWATYKPGVIEDDLTEMVAGMGYWVYMTSPATLTVSGVEMPEPPTVPPTYDVVSGWNLIGFKLTVDIDNTLYLANIDYTVLWGYEADEGYFSVHPMNEHPGVPDETIGDMEVGHGYWLWATSEGTIVLPQ